MARKFIKFEKTENYHSVLSEKIVKFEKKISWKAVRINKNFRKR